MTNAELAARLVAIERAATNLANQVAELRLVLLDEPATDVVGSPHD